MGPRRRIHCRRHHRRRGSARSRAGEAIPQRHLAEKDLVAALSSTMCGSHIQGASAVLNFQ
jgi:hypothetical protein